MAIVHLIFGSGELKNDYKKCVWHAKLFKLAKNENDHQYAL
jgi:hypothetical protein